MFRHAIRGLVTAVKRELNMKLHLTAAAAVFTLAFFLRVEPWEWAVLTLTCALVITAELLNTAIEHLCDKISPKADPIIRDVKDIAAGAVLAAAIFAVVIAAIIFLGVLL